MGENMSNAMMLGSLALLAWGMGTAIYMLFAPGRRRKLAKRAALITGAGIVMLATGASLYSRETEQAKLAAGGFATAEEMAAANKVGASTKAEFDAHLAEQRAKAAAEEQKRQEEARAAEAACKSDLSCWAEKHFFSASASCHRMVEKMAKWDVEWTDGLIDPKFSHYRWRDIGNGVVTYIGDKAKFQNGFGAWQRVVYECDYQPASEQVLDVRVRAGHL
jgi:hypothetical protein